MRNWNRYPVGVLPHISLLAIVSLVICLSASTWLNGQQGTDDDAVRQAIASGEFSRAVTGIEQLPFESADRWRSELVMAQRSHGAPSAAWDTFRAIQSPELRDETLHSWTTRDRENVAGQGGITEADFQELIRLIRRTIDPDSWQENGGDGAIEPFPNGVFVDQSGTLRRARIDASGRLDALRRRAGRISSDAAHVTECDARCVSLIRLERECQIYAARGEPLPELLTNLAGLYRINYVLVDHEGRDLLIVGPAGPWQRDAEGRAIHVATGLPTLQLDDLIACWRNARFDGGKFGCSIEPRQENLVATQRFVETTKARGQSLRDQLAQQLGMQDVVVFGLPTTCQAARVIVEADYLMKLVAVGVEPSIVEVPNYLDRLQAAADVSAPVEIARWWFTADLDRLVTNEDRSVFELQGTGVKLSSETEFLSRAGNRVHTGQANEATEGFARDFTTHFDKLARRYPAFAHLRGVFDLALVSALVEHQGLGQHVGWQATYFMKGPEAETSRSHYRLREGLAPKQVASVVTQRTFPIGRNERQTVTAVSGGVAADFGRIVRNLEWVTSAASSHGEVASTAERAPPRATATWWWD